MDRKINLLSSSSSSTSTKKRIGYIKSESTKKESKKESTTGFLKLILHKENRLLNLSGLDTDINFFFFTKHLSNVSVLHLLKIGWYSVINFNTICLNGGLLVIYCTHNPVYILHRFNL